MDGGKYVSSGTYGCTFSPPLNCKGAKGVGTRKLIGKVFPQEDDGLEEAELQSIIASVDPKGEFTVPMVHRCSIGTFRKTDDAKACKKDIVENESLQLIYTHGGVDLRQFMTDHKGKPTSDRAFVNLFFKFEPVLYGLRRLNEAGWAHLDIKPENIVYDGKHVRLIDFGLLSKVKDLPSSEWLLKYDYPYYPPEFKMHVMLPATLTKATRVAAFTRAFFNNFNFVPSVDKARAEKELDRFIAMQIHKPVKDPAKLFGKADIYSIGVTLTILRRALLRGSDSPRAFILDSFLSRLTNCNWHERPAWDEVIQHYELTKRLLKCKNLSCSETTK